MDAGKMDFLTFTAKDTGLKTSFGVPHSETEWERADLGDGWIRFVSGSKEFKFHPESLEARYRDNSPDRSWHVRAYDDAGNKSDWAEINDDEL